MDPDRPSELHKMKSDEVVRLSGPDASSLIGKVIAGKYEIISFLGEGGMSSVFQARDLVINRLVALKILLSLRSVDERAILRFQKEAMAAGRLNHPNIVQLYDVGTHDDGTPYLVMDYVPGLTLAQRLQAHGQLPTRDALKLFVQVCDALAHAHSNSVIHRDIKPSNLLITDGSNGSEVIKILDFGIAKVWDEALSGQQATRTGEVFGSPLYMSPEQAVGTKVDLRSDIYSTGCALFEALSGLPPHVGETTLSTVMKHQNDKAPSLREASLGREFPADLEVLLSKSLNKKPEERYQSMPEFSAALSSVLRTMDSGSLVKKPIARSTSVNLTNSIDSKKSGTPKARNMMLAAFLVAAFVGLVAFLMWGRLNPSPNVEPPALNNSATQTPLSSTVFPTSIVDTQIPSKGSNQTVTPSTSGKQNPDAASLLPDYSYSDPTTVEFDREIAQRLREKPSEPELRLKDYRLSSAGLAMISKFKSVHKLNLTHADFNDLTPEWAKLAELPLSIFSATNTKITDKGLLAITKIPSLRDLNINQCPELTDESMKNVPRLKLLRKIEAASNKFTDKGLALMAQAENLEMLNLNFNHYIHGDSLRSLVKLKRFDAIKLAGTAVSDATAAWLGSFPHIRVLDLARTRISDASIPMFMKQKEHLRQLFLDETAITDKSIKNFANFELKILSVQKCPGVTRAAINDFRQQQPNCEVFDDMHPYLSKQEKNRLEF
ncbi:hypothetical protein BH10CYA1_BH10CYA1_30970 [soil metagenome]